MKIKTLIMFIEVPPLKTTKLVVDNNNRHFPQLIRGMKMTQIITTTEMARKEMIIFRVISSITSKACT